MQTTFSDNGHILFPSITFCKNYMYNARKGFLKKIQEEDLPVSHYKTVFKDKTWSKAQMFRTVSHNTIDGSYNNPLTLEVGQEWDRRAVSLSCTQIAQKVSKPISNNSNDSSNKHFKPVLVCCGFFQRHIIHKQKGSKLHAHRKQFYQAIFFSKQFWQAVLDF